jgi:hypothetical protein
LISGVVATAIVGGAGGMAAFQYYKGTPAYRARVTKKGLAEALKGGQNIFYRFPTEMDLPIGEPGTSGKLHAVVQYSFDPQLQEAMETIFKNYTPDYGAFVAMDPATGRVLAMVSYTREGERPRFGVDGGAVVRALIGARGALRGVRALGLGGLREEVEQAGVHRRPSFSARTIAHSRRSMLWWTSRRQIAMALRVSALLTGTAMAARSMPMR